MVLKAPNFITECSTSDFKRLNVIVIGCGGTGSEIASMLFKMHATMKALGSAGLNVTLIDDDVVSPSNIGRQSFWDVDISQPKASTLVDRFNNFGGTNWKALVRKFEGGNLSNTVVFGCVDNAIGRKLIHQSFVKSENSVWIDCGNDNSSANVFMGVNAAVGKTKVYVPTVYDLFQAQLDAPQPTQEPSCSTREAIARQDFGINAATANHAVQLLWQLYRHGQVAYHGVTLDLKSGESFPIAADPEIWAQFGYETKPKRTRKKAA